MGHRYDLEVELQEVKVKLEKQKEYIVELETLLDAEVDAWENNVFDTRESENRTLAFRLMCVEYVDKEVDRKEFDDWKNNVYEGDIYYGKESEDE